MLHNAKTFKTKDVNKRPHMRRMDLTATLNMTKFCHHLTKPIITRIIVFLVFENIIIRTACIVFRDFMSLVKHDQILSLFNQAYYYTNYCVFSVGKCYYKD